MKIIQLGGWITTAKSSGFFKFTLLNEFKLKTYVESNGEPVIHLLTKRTDVILNMTGQV